MTEIYEPNLSKPTCVNSEVYEKLSDIGCCSLCSLRFCGETDHSVYKLVHNYEKEECNRPAAVQTNDEKAFKKVASNPCIACLGMLQSPMGDKIIDKIVDGVSKEEYDNPVFNVAFTLPVSFYLRAHALLLFLVQNYPEHVKSHLPVGMVTVGVKDAWKHVFADKVAQRINKTFNHDSDFRIQIDIQYEDDHSETLCLLEMYPNKFKQQQIKRKKLRHPEGPTLLFSRKGVESVMVLEERERFMKFYSVPPAVPSHFASCNNVLFEQDPIFVGGRYNKYSRELPQTAWLVQHQRKLETSVHELIGEHVEALVKAQGSKLISSGREDVDVRMLGTGRPFALELINPKHVVLSDKEMKELEHKINSECKVKITVNQLKKIPKLSLDILKMGEEKKTKTYAAYCVAWGLEEAKLAQVGGFAPLTLQQKTPVRVLHRRPIATRPRAIHWMKVSDTKHSPEDNKTLFKLTLNTQAGTYIKEFINGDFGRTRPSLGDLMGGVVADCLALDVEKIDLVWPP